MPQQVTKQAVSVGTGGKAGALWRSRSSRTSILIAGVAALVVLAIGYTVMRSGAAGFFAFLEPEQAAVSGGAQVVNDASAAGGKALKFAPAVTPPAPEPPTPPVPPGSGAGCLARPSSCGYPDATNTGVPAGQTLTPSGSISAKTAGMVISNKDITGSVSVYAPNVVIRNSRINNTGANANAVAAVRIYDGGSVIIEDSEIDGGNAKLAIGFSRFTLKRVEVRGGSDALRADGDVGVYDSYIYGLNRQPGSHNDILQTISGSNVTIRHNTLFAFKGAPGTWPGSGDPMNAIYQFGNMHGNVSNILVENNLVNGGNYSFNANWTAVDAGQYTATNIRILNNRFGRDHRYGAQTSMTHGIVFSGNAYVDNGAAIR